jgi:hypothetical protein
MENENEDSWASEAAEISRLKTQGLWIPGPTTALEILRRTENERSHQAYIAWLLDPTAEHQLGSRFLTVVLAEFSDIKLSEAELHSATVRIEYSRPESRADIVVSLRGHPVLVIELKTGSSEGIEQLRRLADDSTWTFAPALLFLTPNGTEPGDPRFTPRSFKHLREWLRAVLSSAPAPQGVAAANARANAADYLATLDRICT